MSIRIDQLTDFGNLEFLAKQAVEGFITGLHKSPYNGFSVEFAEHSQYNTGDSTRHIDWKVFGRTDKLYLKNYEDETNLKCQIVLDNSSSMYYPTDTKAKIKFSALATASLCRLMQKQRDAVGFIGFGTDIKVSTPIKSSKLHFHNILTQLHKIIHTPSTLEKTGLVDVLHNVAYKLGKRGLVIIFSDLMENEKNWEETFPALQHLKYNNHEVVIFHVHDKKTEIDFNFENKPHIFTDIETGNKVKVNPNQVKESYIAAKDKITKQIKLKAAQYKIDFIEADIAEPMDLILQSYLIKRNQVR